MALTCTIDASGITAPDYPAVLAELQASYRAIYGQDVYLEPDSQDGQWLATLALGFADVNAMAVAIYNAFSPSTAQGEGLSRVVKINGLGRLVPGYSTAQVTVIGQAGTVLDNALVLDAEQRAWTIVGVQTIPTSGSVTLTAQCNVLGAIQAASGTLTTIGSPTRGWQSVTNAAAASPGRPVESDAQLRRRQTQSTALPSRTILEGITGALLDLDGVSRVRAYENATGAADSNGIAAYALAYVVEGGTDQDVGNAIAAKKTPGVPTQGTIAVTVTNVYGLATPIKFYRSVPLTHWVQITLTAGPTYSSTLGQAMANAIVAYANSLPIGTQLQPARLYGIIDALDPAGTAFAALSIGVSLANGSYTGAAPAVLFNQVVAMTAANVVLVVS